MNDKGRLTPWNDECQVMNVELLKSLRSVVSTMAAVKMILCL